MNSYLKEELTPAKARLIHALESVLPPGNNSNIRFIVDGWFIENIREYGISITHTSEAVKHMDAGAIDFNAEDEYRASRLIAEKLILEGAFVFDQTRTPIGELIKTWRIYSIFPRSSK